MNNTTGPDTVNAVVGETQACVWFPLFLVSSILLLATIGGIVTVLVKRRCPNRLTNSIRYVQTTVRRRDKKGKVPARQNLDTYISIFDPPKTDPDIRPPLRTPEEERNNCNSELYQVVQDDINPVNWIDTGTSP